jgi:2,4-dienoyl-CoA reductase-like NADH-dependent reductase (Old Yellow Enzyme family)
MNNTRLFQPISLRGLELPNRLVVGPMCVYSATDGCMGDWHLMHLGSIAIGGHGLVMIEATGVEPEGRISPRCPGLYSDENAEAMARVLAFCREHGNTTWGVQIAHAGRKASSQLPWIKHGALTEAEGAWQTYAPSAIPFDEDWPTPEALDDAGLKRVKGAFVQAAERAARIDMDLIEIHGAHGYLLHSFMSPISNHRDDEYGGSLENRLRFPLEVFDAVRAVWPENKPLGIRVSATDWREGGWDVESTVVLGQALKERGCDFMDVSSGGNSPKQEIAEHLGPGYQTAFAEQVKRETGLPTIAVGLITEPAQAEHILRSGQADMICMARGVLFDPHWPWRAAIELGVEPTYPPQYRRAHPAFGAREAP